MAPAAAETMSTPTTAQIKSENKKSDKVIEELLSKLSISKAQDEINSTSLDLATFVNGDIEQGDAPTK
jgi:elongation factor 3